MATEGPLMHHSQCTAAVDLSAAQFKAVKVTASRQVNLANTGGEAIDGILQNDPVAGFVADVGYSGISKALAGAAFSAGALLMTDNTARLVTATSTNAAVAKAIEAATGAGQLITVLVLPNGKQ